MMWSADIQSQVLHASFVGGRDGSFVSVRRADLFVHVSEFVCLCVFVCGEKFGINENEGMFILQKTGLY